MQEELLLKIIQNQQEIIDLLQSELKISNAASSNVESITIFQKSDKDIESFKKHLINKGRSENCIDTYVKGVELFFRQYATLNSENLSKYEQELKNKWKPKTVNLRICGMTAYMEYVGFKDYQFHRAKEQKRTFCDNAINKEQYEHLISWAKDNSQKVWLITKVIASTGVRVSELVNLKTAMLEQGYADIIGKGNKQRRIYFPDRLIKDIKNYCGKTYIIENRFGGQMTSRGVSSLLIKAAPKAGVPKEVMHPHSFRHFFAKEFLKQNNDITLLGDLLGHSDISTTAIYTRLTSEEQAQQINEVVGW